MTISEIQSANKDKSNVKKVLKELDEDLMDI